MAWVCALTGPGWPGCDAESRLGWSGRPGRIVGLPGRTWDWLVPNLPKRKPRKSLGAVCGGNAEAEPTLQERGAGRAIGLLAGPTGSKSRGRPVTGSPW